MKIQTAFTPFLYCYVWYFI